MNRLKKLIKISIGFVLLLIIYLLINTFNFKSTQIISEPIAVLKIDNAALNNFSEALKIKTISTENLKDFDSVQFTNFGLFLKNTYPLVDSLLEKKTFNSFSFLYKWQGKNDALKPIVVMAHLDVVPVIKENLANWKHDPFGGNIINDTIWGRGTIDNKVNVVGIMESLNVLLKEGFSPTRSMYFVFGHDEELGGELGAKTIAQYLKEEKIEAEFVLDEGGVITQKLVPGIEKDVALIGVAEKGSLTLELSINLEGGHSSMPEKETAIDVISKAIAKLKSNPFPLTVSPPIEGFLNNVGPEMPFINKIVFANKFIFENVITGIYEKTASGSALVRTTTSPTIFNSGVKNNIIPQSASATLNFRIISGETTATVINRVKEVIDDERIKITTGDFFSEPSKVSNTNSFGYKTLHKTISEIYPETIVTPYLVVAATDSRHFEDISDNIYRFTTIKINKDNIKTFHGINERIAISDFENSIRFYHQIIKNSCSE